MSLARELRYSLTDIPALLSALGMRWRRDGAAYKALCPAHEERTPSCSVRIAGDGTIACRCHGCGWSGDALGLVAIVHRYDRRRDFREILRVSASIAGRWDLTDAIGSRAPVSFVASAAPVVTPNAPAVAPEAYSAIAAMLLELCPLERAPHVADYLERRALLDVARDARLGGVPREQGAIVAELLAAFPRETLARAGVVRGGRDAIDWGQTHPLLIPWRDPTGDVAAIQRRLVNDGRPKYRWPTDIAPREPFGCELLGNGDGDAEIIVTEGALDALARRKLARMRGDRVIVLAIPSATTIRPEWSRYFNGRDVVIAFDADDAGTNAARRFAAEVCRDARTITRERPRVGKDVNDVLLQEIAS